VCVRVCVCARALTCTNSFDRALLRETVSEHLQRFDPQGDVEEQLAALNAHDLPVILSDEEIEVLKAKVDSVNSRDAVQQKPGSPLALAEAVAMAESCRLRCSASGVRGVLRPGALLQLSIDAIDCTQSHCAGNVQLMLTYLNYASNRTPDAAFRQWAANAFKCCACQCVKTE
jgi:hypothetical protein